MKEPTHRLERLISRFLDDEATKAERRELRAQLRADEQAETLFEETSALDRELGYAVRQALGRTIVAPRRIPLWSRIGRVATVAAAACLAAGMWLGPKGGDGDNGGSKQAGWFTPARSPGDTLDRRPGLYERPHIRKRNTERVWVVIPGERPGEYMVVEVDRVRTRVIQLHRDY